jgi:hypothetical protein
MQMFLKIFGKKVLKGILLIVVVIIGAEIFQYMIDLISNLVGAKGDISQGWVGITIFLSILLLWAIIASYEDFKTRADDDA